MNSATQRALQERIEAFAADVTDILTRAVADAVGQALGASVPKRGGRLARGSTKRPAHGRGSSLDTETVLAEVSRAGGRGVEALAKSLQTSTRSLRLPLKKLIAAKKVKTQGRRRGMRYSAVR